MLPVIETNAENVAGVERREELVDAERFGSVVEQTEEVALERGGAAIIVQPAEPHLPG